MQSTSGHNEELTLSVSVSHHNTCYNYKFYFNDIIMSFFVKGVCIANPINFVIISINL